MSAKKAKKERKLIKKELEKNGATEKIKDFIKGDVKDEIEKMAVEIANKYMEARLKKKPEWLPEFV
jgi:hypothetical protein